MERLQQAPNRDAVTGLADARAFHHQLVEEMGRADADGTPLAIVTIDLDLFAAINEKYGKPTGDAVLAECALVLKLALREGDYIARLGGDEFGIVLPDCDLGPARRLAERLRHALEEHRFPRVGQISVSAGVAASPRDGMDPTELLGAAERALGLAKKAGRHRTATAGPSSTH
ncbi:MAG: GGDEF domain-containing protein [Candidatus Eisenbacteria bacterium]|nr:GGDEF domain-containing protein [Candidatus Eisenbacteria bacterium]